MAAISAVLLELVTRAHKSSPISGRGSSILGFNFEKMVETSFFNFVLTLLIQERMLDCGLKFEVLTCRWIVVWQDDQGISRRDERVTYRRVSILEFCMPVLDSIQQTFCCQDDEGSKMVLSGGGMGMSGDDRTTATEMTKTGTVSARLEL